jgi:hypothetical protein
VLPHRSLRPLTKSGLLNRHATAKQFKAMHTTIPRSLAQKSRGKAPRNTLPNKE